MILLGTDAIIIDIDSARKLLKLSSGKTKAERAQLRKNGTLEVLDKLRAAVRQSDAVYCQCEKGE